MKKYLIVKLESFEGRDTFVRCGDDEQDYLYCVIAINDAGHAVIVDNGYRSEDEAEQAWPEAKSLRVERA